MRLWPRRRCSGGYLTRRSTGYCNCYRSYLLDHSWMVGRCYLLDHSCVDRRYLRDRIDDRRYLRDHSCIADRRYLRDHRRYLRDHSCIADRRYLRDHYNLCGLG